MEPKLKNRIYVKKNTAIISLSLSKEEIEISKKLLGDIKSYFSLKPTLEKFVFNVSDLVDVSHHMGGMCYPKIVNKNLKLQGLKNIFCCSSSIFPTSGSVNPTMTICTLANKLGIHLKKTYNCDSQKNE